MIIILIVLLVVPSELSNSFGDFFRFKIIDSRIPAENIHLKEAYLLENGNLYISAETDKGFTNLFRPHPQDMDTKQENTFALTCYYSITEKLKGFPASHSFGMALPLSQQYYDGTRMQTRAIDQLIYVGKGGENLLIWNEDKALSPAPEHIEKRVQDKIAQISKYNDIDNPDSELLFGNASELE